MAAEEPQTCYAWGLLEKGNDGRGEYALTLGVAQLKENRLQAAYIVKACLFYLREMRIGAGATVLVFSGEKPALEVVRDSFGSVDAFP